MTQREHWDSTLQRFCFQKLPEDAVHPDLYARTHDVVTFVCEELKLARPEVVWIKPVSPNLATKILNDWNRLPENRIPPKRPPIIWHPKEDITEGYTPPDWHEFWIRSELLIFPQPEFIAAHETRHVWQKTFKKHIFEDPCKAECDAYSYAFDVLKRYLDEKRKEDFASEIEANLEHRREAKRSALAQCCPHVEFTALDACEPRPR